MYPAIFLQKNFSDEGYFFLFHKNPVKTYYASFEFINRQLKIKNWTDTA